MGTSITSTGVTFPDATTQTTAAVTQPSFPSGTVMLFAQTAAPTGWTKDATNYNGSAIRVVTGTASTGGSVDFTTAFASQTPAGSVALSGGSIGNTTAGGSISVTVSAGTLAVDAGTLVAGATTLSTSQLASHGHTFYAGSVWQAGNSGPYFAVNVGNDYGSVGYGNQISTSHGSSVAANGSGGSHSHSMSGAPSLSGSPSVTGQTFTGTAHNHTLTNPTASFTGTAINLAVKYVDVIRATKD